MGRGVQEPLFSTLFGGGHGALLPAALALVAHHSSSSSSTGKRDAVLSPRHGAFSEQLCLHRAAGEHNTRDCKHALLIRTEAHAGTAAAGWDRVLRSPAGGRFFACSDYFSKGVRTSARTHTPYQPTACLKSALIAPRS